MKPSLRSISKEHSPPVKTFSVISPFLWLFLPRLPALRFASRSSFRRSPSPLAAESAVRERFPRLGRWSRLHCCFCSHFDLFFFSFSFSLSPPICFSFSLVSLSLYLSLFVFFLSLFLSLDNFIKKLAQGKRNKKYQ